MLVIFACAIGARPGAQLAADAEIFVDQHDAVLGALEAGAGRAHGDTGRVVAMETGFGEIDGAPLRAMADLEGVDAVEPDAVRLGIVRGQVGERPGAAASVPLLAGDGAGMAADADIEIDDEAELPLRRLCRQAGHRRAFSRGRCRGRGASPAGTPSGGSASPSTASGCAGSRRMRRSYHAACPVTGSELARRGSSPGGSRSEIAGLSRKARVASAASGARFHAAARLAMAFHVHTVSGLTPSTRRIWHLRRRCALTT